MSSRQQRKEQLRAEREEREREAQAAERRKRMVGVGVAAALALAALVAIVFVVMSGDGGPEGPSGGDGPGEFAPPIDPPEPNPELISNLTVAAKEADCTLDSPPEEGNDHVEGTVEYKQNPPTSGDHFVIPAEDGAYSEAPATEQLVHALEHGRIHIQVAPDVDETVKGQLQGLFNEDPYHMILSPNGTDMPYAVAATGWNQVLACKEPSEGMFDAIRAFRDQYRDQGPEFVP